jgi:hypothetical protein
VLSVSFNKELIVFLILKTESNTPLKESKLILIPSGSFNLFGKYNCFIKQFFKKSAPRA